MFIPAVSPSAAPSLTAAGSIYMMTESRLIQKWIPPDGKLSPPAALHFTRLSIIMELSWLKARPAA